MDNTIHVNQTSRMLTALQRTLPKSGGPSFAGILEEQQDLAAYKDRIHARIDAMSVHPSQLSDNFEISISEAGYMAMQNDPEYEEFVLTTIQKELSAYNPMSAMTGGSTVFLRFGEDQAHYRADMFANDKSVTEKVLDGEEKSFWEQRQERQEAQEEINAQIAEIRAAAKHVAAQKGQAAADAMASSQILTLLLSQMMGPM